MCPDTANLRLFCSAEKSMGREYVVSSPASNMSMCCALAAMTSTFAYGTRAIQVVLSSQQRHAVFLKVQILVFLKVHIVADNGVIVMPAPSDLPELTPCMTSHWQLI